MCLYVHSFDSEKLFGNKKTITCYKILMVDEDTFISPFYKFSWPKKGVVKSDRKEMCKYDIEEEQESLLVCKGIHVYTSLNEAIRDIWSYPQRNTFVIIPVICERQDFVAIGNSNHSTEISMSEAVFNKVRIHKRMSVLFKKVRAY